ncbi:carboxymethylenebutenolidase [Methylophilus rhizosphaerae]|uniref:Carboxymethylenebutenolidase n=1 Tax=Methylophilus rhizosphaerae TaxID=492660 RepID=A0A1G8Z5H2_9PROT|nr:dienelactone hydrolase family protein [Methylophilus rhizosphaerae]SDK10257.1 carboxymethylenebutenolidase [Methylophilus rhizosphaerae]
MIERPQYTAHDFHPEVLRLFDKLVHGDIDRREFLSKAARFAGILTAAGLLEALSPNFAQAQQRVTEEDSRIQSTYVEVDSPKGYGKARGYWVKPADAKGTLPIVLVIHENRGLNPHIEDIARRIALDNFIAFAPDALFPLGGYPGDEDAARELFKKLEQPKTHEDFVAIFHWLKQLPEGNGKVGVIGFCYGGGIANILATRLPDLNAAVPFYGSAPPLALVPNIKSPLLIHFAENDERVNAGWPPYEQALKSAGIPYEAYVYAGTQHGFNNDTTPRFDETAANLAWKRSLEFFNLHLRG